MNDCVQFIIEPFFLPFGQESIFCIYLAPKAGKPRAGVLYLHPFAEEMHKSRRMAALQARQFAQAGYAVLQIDLPGCGDSTGDFEDASWEAWRASARSAHDWLRHNVEGLIVLWGLRLGATLAADLSSQLPEIAALILWQPVTSGQNFLNQFLRIRVASEMFVAQQRKVGTKELRGLLASGQAVEIGGYMLSPTLAAEIDKLRLTQLTIHSTVYWLEVLPTSTDPLSPASTVAIEAWTNSGITVQNQVVAGESFWGTQEIIDCPDLIMETTKIMEKIAP